MKPSQRPVAERAFELATELSKKKILAERGLGKRPPLKEVIFHILLQARGPLSINTILQRVKDAYAELKLPPILHGEETSYLYELMIHDSYYGFQEVDPAA